MSSVILVEPAQMTGVTSITSSFNGESISCIGSTDGVVTVAVVDGSPAYTYNWTDIDGVFISDDQSPTNLGAGEYFVEITDVNGCTINQDIEILSPHHLV